METIANTGTLARTRGGDTLSKSEYVSVQLGVGVVLGKGEEVLF